MFRNESGGLRCHRRVVLGHTSESRSALLMLSSAGFADLLPPAAEGPVPQ